jgi:hypothetical protein
MSWICEVWILDFDWETEKQSHLKSVGVSIKHQNKKRIIPTHESMPQTNRTRNEPHKPLGVHQTQVTRIETTEQETNRTSQRVVHQTHIARIKTTCLCSHLNILYLGSLFVQAPTPIASHKHAATCQSPRSLRSRSCLIAVQASRNMELLCGVGSCDECLCDCPRFVAEGFCRAAIRGSKRWMGEYIECIV